MKYDVDICKALHADMMQSVVSIMNPSTFDSMQEIMFSTLITEELLLVVTFLPPWLMGFNRD